MGKYLGPSEIQEAVGLYQNGLPDSERVAAEERSAQLVIEAQELARQIEDVLARAEKLAAETPERLALLYSLLRQLPVVVFEPVNYSFIGRVAIPVENVLDLLIHLDMYRVGQPVRRDESRGTVEPITVDVSDGQSPNTRTEPVRDIAGIGALYSELLRGQAAIHTAQDLLLRGSTAEGRAELARQTGLSEGLLGRWVRRADLMRIVGVGEEYGELIESAGVRGVAELASQDVDDLYQRMRVANADQHIVRRMPSLDDVRQWIAQAKGVGQSTEAPAPPSA